MDVLAAPWATVEQAALCGCTTTGEDAVDVNVLTSKLLIASEILYRVTGSQWPGEREDRVRPAGRLGAGACGCSLGRPGCSQVSEVELPGYPVVAVLGVAIDGETITEDNYRLDDRRWLVFVDEFEHADGRTRSGWPCCQNMRRASTEVGTFEVLYAWGESPPPGGVSAAAMLGCQFSLACGSESQRRACRLPQRVQTIARQGVSYAAIDKLELFSEGRTGIDEIDLWVGSLLVGRKRQSAHVIDTQAYALRGRKVRRPDWMPGGS